MGRALVALGYDRDFRLLSGRDGRVLGVVPAAGWRRVRVDRTRGTLSIPRGRGARPRRGRAKAFAADRIAARVRAATGASVLVSLGGDVSVAGAPAGGWPVRVVDDRGAPDPLGQIVGIAGGGLATSSVAVRRWRAGGEPQHHIVDPQTGRPADAYWRTVTRRRRDLRGRERGRDGRDRPRRARPRPGSRSSGWRRGSCGSTAPS